MYISEVDAGSAADPLDLPELRRLSWREREIAEIVYRRGIVTATDVVSALRSPLGNAAARSMLNRLVRKRILMRHGLGHPRPFLYAPAVTLGMARDSTVMEFARDFWNGSLEALAEHLTEVVAYRRSTSPVLAMVRRETPPAVREAPERRVRLRRAAGC